MPGGSLDFTEPCTCPCYVTIAVLTQTDIHDEDGHNHVNAWGQSRLHRTLHAPRLCQERKRKEKATPFGVSLIRSQALYWAARLR